MEGEAAPTDEQIRLLSLGLTLSHTFLTSDFAKKREKPISRTSMENADCVGEMHRFQHVTLTGFSYQEPISPSSQYPPPYRSLQAIEDYVADPNERPLTTFTTQSVLLAGIAACTKYGRLELNVDHG